MMRWLRNVWRWVRMPILVSRLTFIVWAFVVLTSIASSTLVLHWSRGQWDTVHQNYINLDQRVTMVRGECSAATASCAKSKQSCADDLARIEAVKRARCQ